MTGEEFKGALSALGWRQADIARKMGVHRNTVSGWAADGAPLWVSEYIGALLGIKGLHDAFVSAPPRQRLESLDDEPLEGSRAAQIAAGLSERKQDE